MKRCLDSQYYHLKNKLSVNSEWLLGIDIKKRVMIVLSNIVLLEHKSYSSWYPEPSVDSLKIMLITIRTTVVNTGEIMKSKTTETTETTESYKNKNLVLLSLKFVIIKYSFLTIKVKFRGHKWKLPHL